MNCEVVIYRVSSDLCKQEQRNHLLAVNYPTPCRRPPWSDQEAPTKVSRKGHNKVFRTGLSGLGNRASKQGTKIAFEL